jgi:hypothetical protein
MTGGASRATWSSGRWKWPPPRWRYLEHLHGDLAARPFVIPYFDPLTPLIINAGTADKMLVAIERGLPFIYSAYSMAGMSTPITPAGTLALMNAELLAGLVLSQLAQEGTPIILGILPAIFDMKTMVSFYDPQSLVMNLVCAEMMAHYRLPHCGTSGSGTGWGPDLLTAGMYWMNHVTSCIGKVGLLSATCQALPFRPLSHRLAQRLDIARHQVGGEGEENRAHHPGGNAYEQDGVLQGRPHRDQAGQQGG